ncbi:MULTISPECIES: NAD(P)-dependent oxidoreductase [Paenibacillus]|uniref:NAD(P)-dependent oxidoreductase n=1 Tax=Paenibacillus TaxID=44249 RepID=UPI00211ABA50|nr:NAD(P)-dependent oxidoreductase [Paenibacillus amylolyticus]
MDENQLDYTGSELKGKTIGIIGLGAIGQEVASFCRVFDMNVQAYARKAVVQSEDVVKMTDFDTLISTSDGRKFHKIRYDFFINNIKRVENGEEPESKFN